MFMCGFGSTFCMISILLIIKRILFYVSVKTNLWSRLCKLIFSSCVTCWTCFNCQNWIFFDLASDFDEGLGSILSKSSVMCFCIILQWICILLYVFGVGILFDYHQAVNVLFWTCFGIPLFSFSNATTRYKWWSDTNKLRYVK